MLLWVFATVVSFVVNILWSLTAPKITIVNLWTRMRSAEVLFNIGQQHLIRISHNKAQLTSYESKCVQVNLSNKYHKKPFTMKSGWKTYFVTVISSVSNKCLHMSRTNLYSFSLNILFVVLFSKSMSKVFIITQQPLRSIWNQVKNVCSKLKWNAAPLREFTTQNNCSHFLSLRYLNAVLCLGKEFRIRGRVEMYYLIRIRKSPEMLLHMSCVS